jgi:hypothetical protein
MVLPVRLSKPECPAMIYLYIQLAAIAAITT